MSFVRPGEKQVLVRAKEFLSSEDGNDFISRLDMISQSFAPVFGPGGIFPSQVDNFLAIVKKDRDAIVYCNELGMIMTVRAKKMHVNAGDPVSADDIADVDRLDLEDGNGTPIQIPADCGVALVLSQGWRKGVFYDYTVFHPEATDRKDDLPRLFGHFYARLLFQEMFSLTEDQWQRLMEWGWFPFIWMR